MSTVSPGPSLFLEVLTINILAISFMVCSDETSERRLRAILEDEVRVKECIPRPSRVTAGRCWNGVCVECFWLQSIRASRPSCRIFLQDLLCWLNLEAAFEAFSSMAIPTSTAFLATSPSADAQVRFPLPFSCNASPCVP